MADRVRALVTSCEISDGQSGTGAGFLRVIRFLLPISIPPIALQSSSSIICGQKQWPQYQMDSVSPHEKKENPVS
jgi:hypothetical protein